MAATNTLSWLSWGQHAASPQWLTVNRQRKLMWTTDAPASRCDHQGCTNCEEAPLPPLMLKSTSCGCDTLCSNSCCCSHIFSAPQFSLKPLPPLVSLASSLTKVENAENAREE